MTAPRLLGHASEKPEQTDAREAAPDGRQTLNWPPRHFPAWYEDEREYDKDLLIPYA
jgi:hypothetical protein